MWMVFRVLLQKKIENDNIRGFVDYTNIADVSTLSDILSFSKAYLKQLENE